MLDLGALLHPEALFVVRVGPHGHRLALPRVPSFAALGGAQLALTFCGGRARRRVRVPARHVDEEVFEECEALPRGRPAGPASGASHRARPPRRSPSSPPAYPNATSALCHHPVQDRPDRRICSRCARRDILYAGGRVVVACFRKARNAPRPPRMTRGQTRDCDPVAVRPGRGFRRSGAGLLTGVGVVSRRG
jgi:hypothetical protein